MRQCLGYLALSLLLVTPAYAQEQSTRSWEDCLKVPVRACVLDKATGLVNLLDRTDQRRQAVVAALAETWAQAGEIDRAVQLAAQVPDRLFERLIVLREIAAAQARAGRHEEAEAAFAEARQLAYSRRDALQRAEALFSIAQDQAAAGMKAAADGTFDQALQAAAAVRIIGEEGRVTLPAPESRLAHLLEQLAMRQAEAGKIGRALEIAYSIDYDFRTRARTLLALADVEMRTGFVAEPTLDDALAAEHDGRGGMAKWPSFQALGARVSSGIDMRLLCDIAKAQARAGLTAKAAGTFDEALQMAKTITTADPDLQFEGSAGELANIADAQREAGLAAAAKATLDQAAIIVEAIPHDDNRARALARLAEVRTKAGNTAKEVFAHALSIARALPDGRKRELTLERIATAQARAGLRGEGARTFAEAVGLARLRYDWEMMRIIAEAQRGAGFVEEAAANIEDALAGLLSGDERQKMNRLVLLINTAARYDHGRTVISACQALRKRLLEATEAITNPLDRAEMLSNIARALPS